MASVAKFKSPWPVVKHTGSSKRGKFFLIEPRLFNCVVFGFGDFFILVNRCIGFKNCNRHCGSDYEKTFSNQKQTKVPENVLRNKRVN